MLFLSVVHVFIWVNAFGQLIDLDFESFLDFLQYFFVLFSGDETDGETARAEAAGTAHPVQVLVACPTRIHLVKVLRHIIIEDNVDFADVDAAPA